MVDEDEERTRVRRGVEHVRIKGTTEELGEIVPPPVRTESGGSDRRDEPPPGAERVHLDDEQG